MPEPYIPKAPNDLIRSADWNQIQIEARREIEQHTHSGGDQGTPLGASGLQSNAVTTPKIADAAVTAAKLADGAVTASKIAPGAITTSTLGNINELRIRGQLLRPAYDYASVEWNWTLAGTPAPIGAFSQTNLHADLAALQSYVNSNLSDELIAINALRTLRVLTDHLDGDAIRLLGARPAYDALLDDRLRLALQRLDLAPAVDDHVNRAVALLNFAYGRANPHLLIALARQCNRALISGAGATGRPPNPYSTNTANQIISAVAALGPRHFIEVLGSFAQLVDVPGVTFTPTPPDAPAGQTFGLMVEAELLVEADQMCLVGIGTETSPPPAWAMRPVSPKGSWTPNPPLNPYPQLGFSVPQGLSLRRRFQLIPVLGSLQPSARVWAVAYGSASLWDLRMSVYALLERDPTANEARAATPLPVPGIPPAPAFDGQRQPYPPPPPDESPL